MADDDKLKSNDHWKDKLTAEEFAVCREKGTERAFTGEYYDCKDPGMYLCKCCANPLFSSETKYDSGSGWPSFWQPVTEANVATETDRKHGMTRTEIHCAKCGSHLGHVFNDGPKPTGQRFCVNSASLKLEKK